MRTTFGLAPCLRLLSAHSTRTRSTSPATQSVDVFSACCTLPPLVWPSSPRSSSGAGNAACRVSVRAPQTSGPGLGERLAGPSEGYWRHRWSLARSAGLHRRCARREAGGRERGRTTPVWAPNESWTAGGTRRAIQRHLNGADCERTAADPLVPPADLISSSTPHIHLQTRQRCLSRLSSPSRSTRTPCVPSSPSADRSALRTLAE